MFTPKASNSWDLLSFWGDDSEGCDLFETIVKGDSVSISIWLTQSAKKVRDS